VSRADDSPRVLVPPPLIFVSLAAAGFALDLAVPWRLAAGGAAGRGVEIAGVIVLAAGLALDLVSLALFLRAQTSPIPFRPARAIVAAGPYRFTRNPMYLGMTLTVAGLGLVADVGWLLVSALAAALVVDRAVIPREEAYLERRFGAAWLDYRRRVRRWL
jgi:protein-S-isoprenylcysteine O-methyltransferase Ste14